jgi:dUTP pyrophosphatase
MKIRLLSDKAKVPTRATPWDAGADLYSVEDRTIYSGKRALVYTGVAIELPDGYVGYICPRSGLAWNYGITVLNAPGVIDSGYRGELMVNLINLAESPIPYDIKAGDKIAQLVIQQVAFPKFEIAESLSDSQRGAKGHGSSGA